MKYKIGDTVYLISNKQIVSFCVEAIVITDDIYYLNESIDNHNSYRGRWFESEKDLFPTIALAKAQLLKEAKDEYNKRIKEINGL